MPNSTSRTRGTYLGEGVVVFPGKASTKTKLHELAHKRMGHEPGVEISVGEFADREIDAEYWAWEAMGKKATHRVGIPAIGSLVVDYGFSLGEAISIVVRRMRRKGIKVTASDIEDLVHLHSR